MLKSRRGSLLRRLRLGLVHAVEGDGEGGGAGGAGGAGAGGAEGGDKSAGNWIDSLPDNIRTWDEVKNSDSPEKFWNQMSNMKSHLGTSIRIPSKDAGKEAIEIFHTKLMEKVPGLMKAPDPTNPEDVKALYKRLGAPDTPDGYTLPEIKDLSGKTVDPKTLDMSLVDVFKPLAAQAGVTTDQFKLIVDGIAKHNFQNHATLTEAKQKDHDNLSKEWGAAFKQNTDIVHTFLEKVNAPPNVLEAVKGGFADSATMTWFHKLATQTLGNSGDWIKDENLAKGTLTPQEAKLRISEIRNNPEHPYYKPRDPAHQAARDLMRSLYLMADPEHGSKPAPGTVFGGMGKPS